MTEIEVRPYGPESTEEERRALKARVKVLEDRVIYVEPVAIETPFSVDLMFDRIAEISERWDDFFIICDFPARSHIDAETRSEVAKRFSEMKHKIKYLAMVSDANVILRVTFKFVAMMSRYFQYSVHKSLSAALTEVHKRKKS